jgi:hypothetical protein
MLLPALLVHINAAFGAVINTNSGFFATDGTLHLSPPPSFFPDVPELTPLPLSFLESVT